MGFPPNVLKSLSCHWARLRWWLLPQQGLSVFNWGKIHKPTWKWCCMSSIAKITVCDDVLGIVFRWVGFDLRLNVLLNDYNISQYANTKRRQQTGWVKPHVLTRYSAAAKWKTDGLLEQEQDCRSLRKQLLRKGNLHRATIREVLYNSWRIIFSSSLLGCFFD